MLVSGKCNDLSEALIVGRVSYRMSGHDIAGATPHHVGCAVEKLSESAAVYADAFGLKRRTRTFDVTSQHVRVCFIELAKGFYLELISALDEHAQLGPFLRTGFYHLCFLVDDLERAHGELRARRFAALDAFRSEAFAGEPCQFFMGPQRHLIELAQMPSTRFADFFNAHLIDA